MDSPRQTLTVSRKTFRLRIVAARDAARVGEAIAVVDPVVIGRDPTCDVVLDDASVSRRHARVELAEDGLRIVDLGSGNGVWIDAQRVTDVVLRPGQQCRIGATTLECFEEAPALAGAALEAATMLIGGVPADISVAVPVAVRFVLRVVEGGERVQRGETFEVQASAATVGRGKDCTVVLDERDVSRRSAKIEAVPGGFLVTDLGGSAGVWLGARQITSEIVPPGVPIRLGPRITVECLLPDAPAEVVPEAPAEEDATRFVRPEEIERLRREAAAPAPAAPAVPQPAAPPPGVRPEPGSVNAGVTDADFGHTVMIQARAIATATRIEEEGERIDVSAHAPFLIDDPTALWYVVTGGILLFTVAVEKGQPVGTRSHFLGIAPGQCFFGFDLQRYGVGSGFLAVAKQGTTVRKISLTRLQQLARDPVNAPVVAALVDTWITGLSKALLQGGPARRAAEVQLAAGQRVEVDTKRAAGSAEGVVWVDLWSGSVLFDDMATPVFNRRHAPFPLTPDSWVQPISDEFGAVSIAPERTAGLLAGEDIWYGLDVFHQVLCECEFINKKLATVDEYVRLQQKAQQREAARDAAYDAIGSVMRTEAAAPQEFLASASAEPVFRACLLVGQALGIEVKEHPNAEEALTYEERVAAVASASGFRTRVVALRGEWWKEDHGPLLGQNAATKAPVALLQVGAGAYERVDPKTRQREKVTAAVADELAVFAHAFYRPFPDGELRVRDVLAFGTRGMAKDFQAVVVMAIIVGFAGTITPFFTGKIFDEAIPQAERSMLVVYGLALLVSAVATSAFKFVQGVATVRIQTRMGVSIQAAVWDRIMNLPVNFFRKFSAGDLSDRAEGVDAIQELVSGAGVAAILGSVSGLFYIGQMFGYDLRLAMLAIVLTATYVGVNMGANYAQLRYQRQEMELRGSITGLVLNLLTGVSKLRICGSELHAFRVWAERFARQRKIRFSIGNIQAIAAVFTTVFPVVSNIFIFMVMIGQRNQAVAGAPAMTTGDFIAFTSAYGLFMAAMQSLGDASLNMLRIVPIYERLQPILECRAEVDSSKAFPGKLKGEIELSHLNFRYDPDGPWIIKDLSLKIKPGEFVAFVGGSGCGKSTLMRLMLGFEMPSSGTVSYDSQDLSQLDLRMVRQQIGVVLQVSRLMPTEIYRNIIGVSSRTIEDAWWAAERAGLADDIRGMPMGMHTYVSEGGGTLSGGQRQRLMIARAIVNRPKVLFLDEATSALDNRSQAIVTESMDKMDATRIVIAHRLSTIINADKICYMEAGHIAEMGNYQELMEKNGLFAQLARRQMV
ncbi:MAG: NHLP bacteriocin export ABC transporter permease/ATPase subunit [Betaproteobacteria bacterium]